MKKRLIWALLALIVPTSGYAQLAYKLPPQPVIDVVDAPRPQIPHGTVDAVRVRVAPQRNERADRARARGLATLCNFIDARICC